MFTQIQLLPDAISEMCAEAMATRTVTITDRYGMMAAILDCNLAQEEHEALDRLLYSIRRGKIAMV